MFWSLSIHAHFLKLSFTCASTSKPGEKIILKYDHFAQIEMYESALHLHLMDPKKLK